MKTGQESSIIRMVGHFFTILKPDPKNVQKMNVRKPNGPVFRSLPYLTLLIFCAECKIYEKCINVKFHVLMIFGGPSLDGKKGIQNILLMNN